MKLLVLVSVLLTSVPQTASAQSVPPTAGTEGKWEGACVRGSQRVAASIFIDQAGARMNGKGVAAFRKSGLTVSFTVPGKFEKAFQGRYSADTSGLTGTLTAEGKVANCSLARRVSDPARVCIRNPDPQELWWKLVPGNPSSAVRLGGGSEDRGSGVAGGKLCWGRTGAEAEACTRSLPQSSYSCG